MRCLFAFLLLAVIGLTNCGNAQDVPPRLLTGHGELDQRLSKLISADEWAINADEASEMADAVFLDAREPEEYTVSHLPDARRLGYDQVDETALAGLPADTPLVVYCTVGYRSEHIAEQLRERGYSKVYNLYGSLYAWKLAGYPLHDSNGEPTNELHTYNKKWGRLVPDSIGVKVY